MAPLLALRRESFEYGTLPASQLFPRFDHIESVQEVKQQLVPAATPSPCAKFPDRKVVSASMISHVLGIQDSVAHVLVDTLISLKPYDSFEVCSPDGELVDVYLVLLFLFLQTCHRPFSQAHRRDVGDVWPEQTTSDDMSVSPKKAGSSALMSAARRDAASSDQDTSQLAFVLKQVPVLLSLLLDEYSPTVTASQFDRLGLLLCPANPTSMGESQPLSSVLPLFNAGSGGSASKDQVQEWLQRNIGTGLPYVPVQTGKGSLQAKSSRQLHFGQPAPASEGMPGVPRSPGRQGSSLQWTIEGVYKSTVVQRDVELGSLSDVKVANCQDAVIYLLAPMKYCSITGCIDCTIVVGPTAAQLKVELCERLQVVAACARLRMHSCRDCTLCLATNHPPCILGDCRNLQLAPYNTYYEHLESHLATAGMSVSPNRWDAPISLTHSPSASSSDSDAPSGKLVVSLLPPVQFMPFIVPFRMFPSAVSDSTKGSTHSNPFSMPQAYSQALALKVQTVDQMRQAVKALGLDDEGKKELQGVIQAYFKEWLVASGNMRQVYDLASMERGENSASYQQGIPIPGPGMGGGDGHQNFTHPGPS